MFKSRLMGESYLAKYMRAPDDGGGDGGGGEAKRPDFVPEKFWSPSMAKAVEVAPDDVKKVFSSYTELEQGFHRKTAELEPQLRTKLETERLAKRPPKAEEYKIGDYSKVKLPDGVTVKVIENHPLLGLWRGIAWENGYSQEQFDSGIAKFIEAEGAQVRSLDDRLKELGDGDTGRDRVKRVDAFISEHIEDDNEYMAMAEMLRTPAQVKAFESLMKKVGKEPDMTKWQGRGGSRPSGGGEAMTLAKLRELQNDPRYWQQGDPAIRKQVADGYAALGKKKA